LLHPDVDHGILHSILRSLPITADDGHGANNAAVLTLDKPLDVVVEQEALLHPEDAPRTPRGLQRVEEIPLTRMRPLSNSELP